MHIESEMVSAVKSVISSNVGFVVECHKHVLTIESCNTQHRMVSNTHKQMLYLHQRMTRLLTNAQGTDVLSLEGVQRQHLQISQTASFTSMQ